ncbi:MAG: hypothetical protein DLD55_04755 [candidate division SR1 bacterium]|nr:MAG: hypothetical protein DLD55_04755 [candidate division SR1 bacterium]
MKECLKKISSSGKEKIDHLYLEGLVDNNRRLATTEYFQDRLKRVFDMNDNIFFDVYKKFWELHNNINNKIIDPLITKETDLSLDDLILLKESFILSKDLDREGLPFSAILKQKGEYFLQKLHDIYGIDKGGDIKPLRGSFFSKYKRYNVLLTYFKRIDHPKYHFLRKALINEYNSGDEELFKVRYNRDFSFLADMSTDEISELLEGLDEKKNIVSMNRDEKKLDQILWLDNFLEYKFMSQLQGLPAWKLDAFIVDLLKSHDIEVMEDQKESILRGMDVLIKQKQCKNIFYVNEYLQTALTCSAACLLSVLNYFKNTSLSSEKESEIAEASKSEFIDGQHFSGIGNYALCEGLDVSLIHGDINLFSNPGISQGLFDVLMYEYNCYLDKFIKNGGVLEIENVNTEKILMELQKGKLILLAGKYGQVLHSILVYGYDQERKLFHIMDPLKGKGIMTNDEVNEYVLTDIGSWMLSVSLPVIKDEKLQDVSPLDYVKRCKKDFQTLIQNAYSQDRLIKLADLNNFDYRKFGKKAYNLSILKENGITVPEGVILKNEVLKQIVLDNLSKQEKQDIIQTVYDLLGKDIIIRSNYLSEDNYDKSFAGHFVSIVNAIEEDFFLNIKKVLTTNHFSNTYDYSNNAGVLIQSMIRGDVSGVGFIDHDQYAIELVRGLNEQLVSGTVAPSSLVIDLNGQYKSSGVISLDEEQISRLRQIFNKIYNLFNQQALDIEFTIKEGQIFILQVRPITVKHSYSHKTTTIGSIFGSFSKIVASKGDFSGDMQLVESKDDIVDIRQGAVIVTNQLYPELIGHLHKIAGIISTNGGQLSHLSIVCREQGIPLLLTPEYNMLEKMKDSSWTHISYDEKTNFISGY